MSNHPNVNIDDLFGREEAQRQEQPRPQQPVQQQAPAQPQSRSAQLRQQANELNQKLSHALAHDYEGYKLDTDQHGQPHFGKKGYAKYEQDKLRLQQLRDEISEIRESEKEERSSAQQSIERAKQLVRSVWEREVKYVNQSHIPEIQQLFMHSLRGINWADPNLRTDTAKEGMISMVFGWAAQEVRKQRQTAGKAPESEKIDAGHEDPSEAGDGPEKNEYGFEKGSIAHDITQQFEERLRARSGGPLAARRDK